MKRKKFSQVIMRGACDITAVAWFLHKKKLIIQDKNHIGIWASSYSTYMAQSMENPPCFLPFVSPLVYPDRNMFTAPNTLLIVSVLSEAAGGYYEHIFDGTKLIRGRSGLDADINYPCECVPSSRWQKVSSEYRFLGRISVDEVVENYRNIVNAIAPSSEICILLGPTFGPFFGEMNDDLKEDARAFFTKLNSALASAFSSQTNVTFIDPAKVNVVPKQPEDVFYHGFQSITHYSRRTYLNIAKSLRNLYGRRYFSIFYTKMILRRIRKMVRPTSKTKNRPAY